MPKNQRLYKLRVFEICIDRAMTVIRSVILAVKLIIENRLYIYLNKLSDANKVDFMAMMMMMMNDDCNKDYEIVENLEFGDLFLSHCLHNYGEFKKSLLFFFKIFFK